jgi:hypothetical protein
MVLPRHYLSDPFFGCLRFLHNPLAGYYVHPFDTHYDANHNHGFTHPIEYIHHYYNPHTHSNLSNHPGCSRRYHACPHGW